MIREIVEIPVLYVPAEGGPAGAQKAFDRLETSVGPLKGRKFYGVFYPAQNDYRACVEPREEEDAGRLGLVAGAIPAGRYAQKKLKGWASKIDQIGPTFDELAKEHAPDHTRPSVEYYRRHDELVAWLPVK